jgi:hypothetical protein
MDTAIQGRQTEQVGLYALWPNARRQEQQVLDDLHGRFDILGIYEIDWTPRLLSANYQRFYSDLQLRGVYHANRKGAGKFLVIPVQDTKPRFQQRMTSKGHRLVNANFLDAKMLYREWSDDLNVHCSETVTEANRDLTMLLGTNVADTLARSAQWSGKTELLKRDINGAEGWDSLEQLFYVLNNAVDYVVLNTDAVHPDNSNITIQLATDNYYGLHTLLSSRNYLPLLPEYGCTLPVNIGGQQRQIGLRHVGDRFLDPDWMQEILSNRVLDYNGYYRADETNHFLLTTYCAYALRSAPLNIEQFLKYAPLPPPGRFSTVKNRNDIAELQQALRHELHDRQINHPQPMDATVCFNGLRQDMSKRTSTAESARLSATRSWAHIGALVAAQYWRIRDTVILFAPWISQARNALRSKPG